MFYYSIKIQVFNELHFLKFVKTKIDKKSEWFCLQGPFNIY